MLTLNEHPTLTVEDFRNCKLIEPYWYRVERNNMTAMAKRVFWQQTPEGRARIGQAMKERWAKKNQEKGKKNKKPEPLAIVDDRKEATLLNQLDDLHRKADKRLAEIEEAIGRLQDEKAALLHAFKNDYHRQNQE